MGTSYNDVWSSTNGVNWSEATDNAEFIPRGGHTSVVLNGAMWVIGGIDGFFNDMNDVHTSTDGISWTRVYPLSNLFSERAFHTSVVFNNAMWVIGGEHSNLSLNDVWSSSDGAHWTDIAATKFTPARQGHSSVVFDNKIWVIGGLDKYPGGKSLNDVWSSPDGITWSQVTQTAPFTPTRYRHTSVVFNGAIWVIGGRHEDETTTSQLNDVWYSLDGASWTQVTASGEFPKRSGHTSVVFDNAIWVIAGSEDGALKFLNDVWYLK